MSSLAYLSLHFNITPIRRNPPPSKNAPWGEAFPGREFFLEAETGYNRKRYKNIDATCTAG